MYSLLFRHLSNSLTEKSVLITGCSSGFGFGAVPLFLERGWRVFATMRSAESRKDLFAESSARYGSKLSLHTLDVCNADDRAKVLAEIGAETGGRLGCLINNAGLGVFGALEDLSEGQIRAQMEVNFFGLVLLTRDTLPLLRAAGGKVINLSSILGLMGAPVTSMYCASKFAVEGLSESIAHELRPYGVPVTLVEPGGHRTKFGPNVTWGERSMSESSPYFLKTKKYRENLRSKLEHNATPMDGAIRKIVAVAESSRPPLRVRCGVDAKLFYAIRCVLPEFIYRHIVYYGCKILYYRD